ncbi:MAG: Membrane protein-like protein [Vampirovibrio sp.]|jgi:membrane protein|nr:Membrane protein-like protein [Vampirovibrio sp.]
MDFLKHLWARIQEDDIAGLSAEMTYNWMLALVPTLIFVFALFGMFGVQSNLFGELLVHLQKLVPHDAFALIQASLQELTKDSNGSLAIISFLGALWTASNGAVTLEKAINRASRCTEIHRSFWMQRAVALLLVIGLGILLFVCANLIVFGEIIFNTIQRYIYLPSWTGLVFSLIRWTIPIAGLILISAFIYYVAPDYWPESKRKESKKHIWRGSLTFVSLWIIVSWLFSLYVTNMGNYNKIYGPMGAIVILLIWLYLTSFSLLCGSEVNGIFNECKTSKSAISSN